MRVPVIGGLWARYQAAAATAEALAWWHSAAGVQTALEALMRRSQDPVQVVLVAWLTKRRFSELRRTPLTERERLFSRWLRRPGQMIAPSP